jgi:ABC-type multidrug transport system ATPase subunit
MIEFHGVSFAYQTHQAPILAEVDLRLTAGLNLLVGPNGCGKSTVLKLAAGIDPPDRGHITIDGHDLWRDEVAARTALAFVPEQPDLTPYATIGEILALVCRLRDEPPSSAAAALAFVGLGPFAGRSVRQLSMGQRRKAVLAAALIGKPPYLLLDEPLEAMDRAARDAIVAWLEERRAAGALLLVASHDLAPFLNSAARALTVRDGRCLLVDPLPNDTTARAALLERLARGEAPDRV